MDKKVKKAILISVISLLSVGLATCGGFCVYYGIMNSYTYYTDDGTFVNVPDSYDKKATEQGTIVSLDYKTSTYYQIDALENHNADAADFEQYKSREDEVLNKKVYIYLPYGYDENDATTKYDILYHIHGTWCDGTTLIKGVGQDSETKNVLDNLMENGDMKHTIVAFPSWYNGNDLDKGNPDYLVAHFNTEFLQDVIPAVESTYHTYSGITSDMDQESINSHLKSSRDHRAVSGYSRGGILAWYVFAEMLDYFHYFMPMSGDYLFELMSGTEESCLAKSEILCDKIDAKGYSRSDYYIFNTVGALDFAYGGVKKQFNAMIEYPDHFRYGKKKDGGNLSLCVAPRLWHGDVMCPQYFYNVLPSLFI